MFTLVQNIATAPTKKSEKIMLHQCSRGGGAYLPVLKNQYKKSSSSTPIAPNFQHLLLALIRE